MRRENFLKKLTGSFFREENEPLLELEKRKKNKQTGDDVIMEFSNFVHKVIAHVNGGRAVWNIHER